MNEPQMPLEITRKTKEELLARYATKEPRRFLQFHGCYAGCHPGIETHRDETWERADGARVRILIDPEADCDKRVCKILRSILERIQYDGLATSGCTRDMDVPF
jgi:hypothetical protein